MNVSTPSPGRSPSQEIEEISSSHVPPPNGTARDKRQETTSSSEPYGIGKSVELSRLLADTVTDYAIHLLDHTGKVVSWNAGAESLKGFRREEILGQYFGCFYTKEDRERGKPEEELLAAAQKGRIETQGWRVRKDGPDFWADVAITAIRDSRGVLQGFSKVTRDLTERRRAEENLRRQTQMFERLFENAPDATILVDSSGNTVRVNRQMETLFGYSREEVCGQQASILLPERFREHYRRFLASYFDAPRDHAMGGGLELLALRSDGGEIPVDVMLSPFETEDGIHALVVARDIRERRRMEQMQLQFQALFEALPGLYLVLTPDFVIAAASNAYLDATMTRRDDILGRGLFDVFPDNPDDPEASGESNLRASLERVRQTATSDTMAIQKYDVRRRDGMFEERYWSPVNAPVVGPDGNLAFIIHRVQDVTDFVRQKQQHGSDKHMRERVEQMEAEIFQSSQRLQASNELLRSANQELEAFSYSVSHDLRAPLRHVAGFVELLQRDATSNLSEKSRGYLRTITQSAKRMGDLIDDLLAFSRVGRVVMQKTEVNLNHLVEEVMAEFRSDTHARNITWDVATLPHVLGDRSLLRMVLMNLFANAVKFTRTRSAPVIEVGSMFPGEGRVTIFVRDNGVGFDAKYIDKLFGVFQRLHSNDEFEGTGIGLANVQRIILRHNGRVWAEGALDRGATFYLSIPEKHEH